MPDALMPNAATPIAVRTLVPEDIFSFCHINDVRIAPDGGKICFVKASRNAERDERRSVLMLSDDRRTWRELPDSGGASAPRWAPGGRRLAFIRSTAGRQSLVVHDTDGDAAFVLLETPAALREIAWSPDGCRIAFQMHVDAPPPSWLGLPQAPSGATWAPPFLVTERLLYRHDTVGTLREGSFQTFVTAATAGAEPRQLTSGAWSSGYYHTPGLAWSADATELLLTANRRADWDLAPNELDIHAISVADGRVRGITDRPGPTATPSLSPDGRYLAYTGVEERHLSAQRRRLYLLDTSAGTTRELLAGFDRSIDSLAWAGDALIVCYDDCGGRAIARLGLDDDTLTPLVRDVGGPGIEMPYAGGGFSAADDGTIAYIRTSITTPAEVAVIAPDGTVETLIALNDDIAQQVGGFAPAEMFHVTGRDGHRIQCWLILPKTAPPGGRHKLILEIHGGPFASYGDRFSIKHQMLAAAGYGVLFANPRGSTGYGEAFGMALHDRYPGPDHDDLMDALDVVAARPDIDPGKLFITGISGGGTLSLWAIARTHRFRAAVSIKPVVAWESWMLTADIGPIVGRTWLGGALPWEEAEKYRIRSPITELAASRTPTMLIAGEADSRTPISEAQQAYAVLKLIGVEAALVRGPGVSHSSGAMRPSHFASEVACTLAWFDRFSEKA